MITHLNLRKNRITNIGAKCIVNWILLHDNTLTNLDISRNRISSAGAYSFHSALKLLTRILDL